MYQLFILVVFCIWLTNRWSFFLKVWVTEESCLGSAFQNVLEFNAALFEKTLSSEINGRENAALSS